MPNPILFIQRKQAGVSRFYFALCIVLIFFSGCGRKENRQQTSNAAPAAKVHVPVFNADSAYAFVQAQCDFGPRVPNSKQHDACAEYLVNKMRPWCDTVIIQKGQVTTFNKIRLNIQNIICRFNPAAANRILLFAHWDTRQIGRAHV